MRLPTILDQRRHKSRFVGNARLTRARLWLAMLGLAILPMLGVILITNAFSPKEAVPAPDGHAWETAAAAAELTAAEKDIEARLLAVAGDADIRKLVDGVDGAGELATATKAVSMLEMGDRGVIEGVCLTRSLDGSQVVIDVPAGSSSAAAACGSTSLVEEALSAPPGGVVRGTTSRQIVQLVRDAGALEVHMRIASPPIIHSDYYGIDTPREDDLFAARHTLDEMCHGMGADSLAFLSVDGIYRSIGIDDGRNASAPQLSDHCFTGDYPTALLDLEEFGEAGSGC